MCSNLLTRKLDYTNSSPLAYDPLLTFMWNYQWHNECFKRFNSFQILVGIYHWKDLSYQTLLIILFSL